VGEMLSKIPGLDPIILHNVKERTQKQIVHDAQNLKVTDHEQKNKGRQWKKEGNKKELAVFLEELNQELNKLDKPIRLRMVEEEGFWRVEVFEVSTGKVLGHLSPQRAGAILSRSINSAGLLIDDKA